MNEYIKSRLQKAHMLPEGLKQNLFREAEALSSLGVSSDNDYKDAFYISLHAKKIAEELSEKQLNNHELAKISAAIMQNRIKYPIHTILDFYLATANALKEVEIPIKKIAYPQSDAGQYFPSPYNRTKWMNAMRAVYANSVNMDRTQAFELVTKNWEKMEKDNFKHWMSFYEQHTHNKYKTAQKSSGYMEVGQGAYLPLDVNSLKASIPMPDMSAYEEPLPQVKPQSEKERLEIIQKEIIALIGRLNSAERIATKTEAVRNVLGPEGFKTWLNALHTIKREIQTAPIMNIRSATPRDLIIKQANILVSKGYLEPARLMMVLAQVAPPPLEGAPGGPPPAEVAPGLPGDPGAGMGTEPTPDMPGMGMGGEGDDSPEAAMKEFLEGLSGDTYSDEKDKNKNDDANDADDLLVTENDLVATAQAVDPAAPKPVITTPTPEHFAGDEVELALKNVTIETVIEKLEALAKVYGNRELARQLNIVDLMLGRLGLATFFPNLAEAMRSALDSNQYVLTRVEEIISKLKSSTEGTGQQQINLVPSGPGKDAYGPDIMGIKSKLETDKEKDKARKEKRKVMQEAEEAAKVAPAPTAPTAPAQELAVPAVEPAPAPVRT